MVIDRLEREIEARSARSPRPCWPCRAAVPLTAAKLVGEVAGIGRFRSARRPSPATTAPRPCRSGPATAPPPPDPGRQPPAQRRPPPHRHHPAAADGRGRTTSPSGWPPVTRRPRPSAPSGAASATRSTAGCATMTTCERQARNPWRWPLDIGATHVAHASRRRSGSRDRPPRRIRRARSIASPTEPAPGRLSISTERTRRAGLRDQGLRVPRQLREPARRTAPRSSAPTMPAAREVQSSSSLPSRSSPTTARNDQRVRRVGRADEGRPDDDADHQVDVPRRPDDGSPPGRPSSQKATPPKHPRVLAAAKQRTLIIEDQRPCRRRRAVAASIPRRLRPAMTPSSSSRSSSRARLAEPQPSFDRRAPQRCNDPAATASRWINACGRARLLPRAGQPATRSDSTRSRLDHARGGAAPWRLIIGYDEVRFLRRPNGPSPTSCRCAELLVREIRDFSGADPHTIPRFLFYRRRVQPHDRGADRGRRRGLPSHPRPNRVPEPGPGQDSPAKVPTSSTCSGARARPRRRSTSARRSSADRRAALPRKPGSASTPRSSQRCGLGYEESSAIGVA